MARVKISGLGAAILTTALVALVVGAAIRRWWAPALPILGVAVFFAGLNARWWGHGVGEFWWLPMALLMVVALFATMLGIWIRLLGASLSR